MDNWKETLHLNDNQIHDLRFLGYCYIKQGCYETALKFFKGLYIISSKNAYDLQTLGALQLQLGHYHESIEILEEALELDPNHLPTKLNLVKALYAAGLKQRATSQTKLLANCPDPHIADQATALLFIH